jgi:hypothetical protein
MKKSHDDKRTATSWLLLLLPFKKTGGKNISAANIKKALAKSCRIQFEKAWIVFPGLVSVLGQRIKSTWPPLSRSSWLRKASKRSTTRYIC